MATLPTLDELLDRCSDFARKRMIDGGDLMPTIHAITHNGEHMLFMIPDYGGLPEAEKPAFRAALGQLMHDKGCIMYCVMHEAWKSSFIGTLDEAQKAVKTMSPPEDPAREEVVILTVADLLGNSRIQFYATIRDAAGKVTDIQLQHDEYETVESGFTSLLSEAHGIRGVA